MVCANSHLTFHNRRLSCEKLNKHSARLLPSANNAKECGKLKNSIFFIASFSLYSSFNPFSVSRKHNDARLSCIEFSIVVLIDFLHSQTPRVCLVALLLLFELVIPSLNRKSEWSDSKQWIHFTEQFNATKIYAIYWLISSNNKAYVFLTLWWGFSSFFSVNYFVWCYKKQFVDGETQKKGLKNPSK